MQPFWNRDYEPARDGDAVISTAAVRDRTPALQSGRGSAKGLSLTLAVLEGARIRVTEEGARMSPEE